MNQEREAEHSPRRPDNVRNSSSVDVGERETNKTDCAASVKLGELTRKALIESMVELGARQGG